jgi:FixJ family two-component response regulator
MQGPDLAQRLRAVRPGLPVLFMSGYAEELLAGLTPGAKGVHVLDKPFDAPTLHRAVRAAMDEPR